VVIKEEQVGEKLLEAVAEYLPPKGQQLVREALWEYLARTGGVQPSPEPIDEVLLAPPFDDPDPDPVLSTNVDHYLYGAPRRTRRRR
jgi:hypothetical protein